MNVQRVHNDGQGGSHALISAAGDDDDGQLAAAHPCVRARRGLGACAYAHVVTARFEKSFADRRAVVSAQPLLTYGEVILYLTVEHIAYVLKAHGLRKIEDIAHVENAAVSLAALAVIRVLFKQHLAVFLYEHDICVIIADAKAYAVRAAVHVQVDIQKLSAVGFNNGHLAFVHELCYLRYFLGLYIGQHLKLPVRVADDGSGSYSRSNALEPARVRNDDAFYVFNYVSAYDDIDLIGHFSERLTRPCCRIGHCDRLRAAHCRQELFTQYLQVLRILNIAKFHFNSLRMKFSPKSV